LSLPRAVVDVVAVGGGRKRAARWLRARLLSGAKAAVRVVVRAKAGGTVVGGIVEEIGTVGRVSLAGKLCRCLKVLWKRRLRMRMASWVKAHRVRMEAAGGVVAVDGVVVAVAMKISAMCRAARVMGLRLR